MTRPMQLVVILALSVIVILITLILIDSRTLNLPFQLPAESGRGGLQGLALQKSLLPVYHPYRCGWSPTFFEDFNGKSLDYTNWRSDYPAGERERQQYTRDAFELEDGLLKIRADKRQVDDRQYASGIITTQGLFDQEYGRFEIRAKMPSGRGFWPAFWLLPTSENYPLELDVLEVLGHEPDTVNMSHHWRAADGSTQDMTQTYSGPDFSKGFHNFSLEWSADSLVWRVDGIERAQASDGIPHEPMFLLVNLAVGGAWPGDPDATTQFPGYYQIDYVRVSNWFCD